MAVTIKRKTSCKLTSDIRGALRLAFPRSLPERDRLMLTLHAYFDESGTHDDSEAIVVAGYLSTAEQWALFIDEWNEALSEWNLDFFHMVDFANHAEEYAHWTDDQRRFRFARLAAIIKRHTLASVAIGFMRSAYNTIFDKGTKRFVGGPYGAAASMCFLDVADRMRPSYPSARIAYVFESGGPGHGQILSVFEMNDSLPENREHFMLLSLKFENKRDFAPLQAADILAYEIYRHLPRHVGTDSRPVRSELRHLVPDNEQSIKGWGWLSDDELMKIANISHAAWKYHGQKPLQQVAHRLRKQEAHARRLVKRSSTDGKSVPN
jgi:hypothetical protein